MKKKQEENIPVRRFPYDLEVVNEVPKFLSVEMPTGLNPPAILFHCSTDLEIFFFRKAGVTVLF